MTKQIVREIGIRGGAIVQLVTRPSAVVTFIDGSANPMKTITKLVNGYKGNYDPGYDPDELAVSEAVQDILKTKLQTPLEMMYSVWLLNDVPRSFTHQLVRTRLASYVQESMRFLGHRKVYKILVDREVLKDDQMAKQLLMSAATTVLSYEDMLKLGYSSEKARGILPTDILTSIYFGISLSSLRKMYEQRMCCQAQPGIWQDVMRTIKYKLIQIYGEEFRPLISSPVERGESCGYGASFDRPCTWEQTDDNSSV